MPELFTFTVAPEPKFVPVNVTFTVAPGAPELGLSDVSVGAAELIVNVTDPLVPPAAAATVTLAEPEALLAIVRLAVI